MATIRATLASNGLRLHLPDGQEITVSIPDDNDRSVRTEKVSIWDSEVEAIVLVGRVNSLLSNYLGIQCRLAYMPDWSNRRVNPKYGSAQDSVSFADGYPYLIIGEESLMELNRRLVDPIPMTRFRPNLVFSGGEPFSEDKWRRIRVGKTVFRLVKPCARCVITTIDQESGIAMGPEPLRTLATFRRIGNAVLFGQNMVAENPGSEIRIGDPIEIIEFREEE